MVSCKACIGAAMIAIGVIALGGNILKNFITVPLADLWIPALIIVAAGIMGSLVIWGEMEEKKIEKGIIKVEKKLLSKVKRSAKKPGK